MFFEWLRWVDAKLQQQRDAAFCNKKYSMYYQSLLCAIQAQESSVHSWFTNLAENIAKPALLRFHRDFWGMARLHKMYEIYQMKVSNHWLKIQNNL